MFEIAGGDPVTARPVALYFSVFIARETDS